MKALSTLAFIIALVALSCKSGQVKNEKQPYDQAVAAEDEFFNDNGAAAADPASSTVSAPVSTENAGYASWYGKEMQNKPTASGELYDLNKFTAAHRSLPMGSIVLVKNLENNKKQLVRVNDRGPYVEGRVIDVSYAAARDLGFAEKGVAMVEIELIQAGKDDFLSKARLDAKEPVEELNEEELLDEEPEEKSAYTFADGARPAGHTIQIGAFKNRANGEKFRADMEDQYGNKGFIASKGPWHYVWLGDFRSKQAAKKFQKKLKAEGVDVVFRGKSS